MNRLASGIAFLAIAPYVFAQQYLISTVAGGAPAATPVNALATSIGVPNGVALDAAGNLYFSGNQCVFRVDRGGNMTRVAGNSRRGYAGDGGHAVNAQLRAPFGVAVDAAGNVYIADELNQRIRKVLPNGIIVTVAGNGTQGYSGDGGAAVDAQLSNPINVLVDAAGNLYIADFSNNRIRKVAPSGIITTIAGGGSADPGDNGPATNAVIANPSSMALDAAGNLYIADRERMRVRKVSPGGVISTIAGNGKQGYSGDGGPAVNAQLYLPTSVAVDSSGDVYIADFANNQIRVVSGGIIRTVPGLSLSGPAAIALDATGNLYIADQNNHRIQKVFIVGLLSTAAGNGVESFSGDGGPATSAQLNLPSNVVVDATGNVYIADYVNGRVRKITPGGTINTILTVAYPNGLAIDSAGNLYVAESISFLVVKVTHEGVVSTVAGNGTQGYSGDGGPAINAQLTSPGALAVDASGSLFIADNNAVRKVTASGTISTLFAGVYSGASGLAVDSSGTLFIAAGAIVKLSSGGTSLGTLNPPINIAGPIAVDAADNVYATGNNGVLKISPSGAVSTIAGNGTAGYSGDGGPATNAQLYIPGGLAIDGTGRIYVADYGNFAVRMLTPAPSLVVSDVVDAASEQPGPVSPGKIVAIYGSGLAGATVSFNGLPAIVLYSSATQLSVAVPPSLTGTAAQVTVANQGQTFTRFPLVVAPSAPSLFTLNGTGAGQAAAINDAAHPVAVGGSIVLYATGVGQSLPVSVTVGGIAATVQLWNSAVASEFGPVANDSADSRGCQRGRLCSGGGDRRWRVEHGRCSVDRGFTVSQAERAANRSGRSPYP